MTNDGLPPAHLPSPNFVENLNNHVETFRTDLVENLNNLRADLMADLRAIVSEYAARARQEDERRRRQLLDEQAARARQEATAACDQPGCASQDDDDAYDEYVEYDDEKYDDEDEYDDEKDDDEDEYDDTTNTVIGVADGGLTRALSARVPEHGPVDLLAFDGCNMGAYEVVYALRGVAEVASVSQSWVGWEGLQYTPALETLRENPDISTADFADALAYDAVTREIPFVDEAYKNGNSMLYDASAELRVRSVIFHGMPWDSFARVAYGFNEIRGYGDVNGDDLFDTSENALGDELSNETEPAGFRYYIGFGTGW
jgi:hypothetical protein